MDIFIRLILAHLLGDFPFQTEKVYAIKIKGGWGVVPHVAIVTACFILLLWPYLHIPIVWGFILFTFVMHLWQDITKLKIAESSKHQLMWYIIDQGLHILTVAVVFLTDIKNYALPNDTGNYFVSLYNNDAFIIYMVALITASYNGHWLLMFGRGRYGSYSPFEKWYGITERSLILTLFLSIDTLVFLIPLVFLLRPIIASVAKNWISINKKFSSLKEIILSGSVSIATGIIFYVIF